MRLPSLMKRGSLTCQISRRMTNKVITTEKPLQRLKVCIFPLSVRGALLLVVVTIFRYNPNSRLKKKKADRERKGI